MGSVNAGDEKLEPDALRGGELADEDLEDLTGGSGLVPFTGPVGSAAKEDAPSGII
jgi:hypothetical protein